jgi:transcriptional regulator with XRE-family HTH domain
MTGEELRAKREALGMTQTELARYVGVGLRTLREWESNFRPLRPLILAVGTLAHLHRVESIEVIADDYFEARAVFCAPCAPWRRR